MRSVSCPYWYKNNDLKVQQLLRYDTDDRVYKDHVSIQPVPAFLLARTASTEAREMALSQLIFLCLVGIAIAHHECQAVSTQFLLIQ